MQPTNPTQLDPSNADQARERRQLVIYLALTAVLIALTVCDLLSDVFLRARSVNIHAAGSVGPLWFDWDLTLGVVGLFWVWLSHRLWRRR